MLLLNFVAAVAGYAAQPPSKVELLRIDAPDEFGVGYRASNDSSGIVELIVAPETVETWSKLITLQVIYGASNSPGLSAFYSRWRTSLHQACPGTTDTLQQGAVDGRPALKGELLCPKNPQTGKPENLAAVLVRGDTNLLMVQVAFRRPITAADQSLIDRIVRSLKVCDERALAVCEARKAKGFVSAN